MSSRLIRTLLHQSAAESLLAAAENQEISKTSLAQPAAGTEGVPNTKTQTQILHPHNTCQSFNYGNIQPIVLNDSKIRGHSAVSCYV